MRRLVAVLLVAASVVAVPGRADATLSQCYYSRNASMATRMCAVQDMGWPRRELRAIIYCERAPWILKVYSYGPWVGRGVQSAAYCPMTELGPSISFASDVQWR